QGFLAGDVDLYRYVFNLAPNASDPLGLAWHVFRRGDAKAVAIPDPGDTVQELANQIGLNASEFRNWFSSPKFVNVGSGDVDRLKVERVDVNTPMIGGELCYIPNTIYAIWAGDLGSFGKWGVNWYRDLGYLQAIGFNVQLFDYDNFRSPVA